nr:hypothetical protein [Actinoplanes sp. NBRC 103695]
MDMLIGVGQHRLGQGAQRGQRRTQIVRHVREEGLLPAQLVRVAAYQQRRAEQAARRTGEYRPQGEQDDHGDALDLHRPSLHRGRCRPVVDVLSARAAPRPAGERDPQAPPTTTRGDRSATWRWHGSVADVTVTSLI